MIIRSAGDLLRVAEEYGVEFHLRSDGVTVIIQPEGDERFARHLELYHDEIARLLRARTKQSYGEMLMQAVRLFEGSTVEDADQAVASWIRANLPHSTEDEHGRFHLVTRARLVQASKVVNGEYSEQAIGLFEGELP